MRYVYLVLIGLVSAIVLLFTVQNLAAVTISFLTANIRLPLSVLVIVIYALGMLTGGSLSALLRGLVHGARTRGPDHG